MKRIWFGCISMGYTSMEFISMGHTSIKLKNYKLLTGLICGQKENYKYICSKAKFRSKTNFCLNLTTAI